MHDVKTSTSKNAADDDGDSNDEANGGDKSDMTMSKTMTVSNDNNEHYSDDM